MTFSPTAGDDPRPAGASPPAAFIEVSRVSHAYEAGELALENVSLKVAEGAFVALVGKSGVGKSTLLRLIAGLLTPTRGTVRVGGEDPTTRREAIGLVFQQDNLMPWRTAAANVRLPLELAGQNGPEAAARVQALLKLVGLTGFDGRFPAQLSGGMAQRVAIARALVHAPELLLLDEPFGALDALTRERMGRELLRIWQAMPVTVFMVTHSIAEAVLLADEVLVMNGRAGTITHRFPIPLPRPREQALERSAAFHDHVAAIRDAIRL